MAGGSCSNRHVWNQLIWKPQDKFAETESTKEFLEQVL